MNRLKFALRLFVLVLFTTAFASGKAGYEKVTEKTLFNGEKLYEYRLDNGFRVLFVPRHKAEVLTYQVWFRVGSLNEKLDPTLKKTGLAHLFVHMMFRGSKNYPDGKFDEITSRIGSEKQNATTYYYRTNYYESVPSSKLETIMELEADRMANLNLKKEVLEKEKGAVVGEYRRAMDQPTRKAWYELMRLMYRESPYRWTVLGSEEEIKGFTLEEAQYFYKTFYAPNNATLIVIGDTTEEKLMGLVTEYYGGMKAQQVPRPPVPDEPIQKKERKETFSHRQATSEILMMGYRIPSISHPDIVPLSLLSTHLSTGMESRFRKLLVDRGIAVGASAGTSSSPDVFQVFVNMAEGQKSSKALSIIDNEISSIVKKGISEKEFRRALNQELLNLYDDISDSSSLGTWLGEYLMLSDNYMRGFEVIDAYKSIKPEDLQRVAKQYLTKKNRSVVVVTPAKKGTS